MKLYIINLPRLSLPRTAFTPKQEAVKAARAAMIDRGVSLWFGPADLRCLDLPATKAGLIRAYEAGFNDGQTHGESI